MNSIQVADETFVAADPVEVGKAVGGSRELAAVVARPAVDGGRGPRRASGTAGRVAGALTGTMEIWLEPSLDGVVLHYFLHAEPSGRRRGSWPR